MGNFEDKIQKAMEDFPTLEANEKMLSNVLARLNRKEQNPTYLGRPGLLLLLLASLFGTGLGAGYYLFSSRGVNKMASEISDAGVNRVYIIDTIYEKKITVVYDTIYHTIHQEEKSNQNKHVWKKHQNREFVFESHINQLKEINNGLNTAFFDNVLSLNLYRNNLRSNYSLVRNEQFEIDYNKLMDPIEPLSYSLFKINRDFKWPELYDRVWLEKIASNKKSYWAKTVALLKPKNVGVSLAGGKFITRNLPHFNKNTSAELEVEYGFSDNLRAVIGFDYLISTFGKDIESGDLNKVDGFPDQKPNSINDQLVEIKGEFDYIQFPLGLKYSFFKNKRLRPFISMAIILQSVTKSEVEYEYGGTFEYEKKLSNLLDSKFSFSDYSAGIGLSYDLKSNWSVLFEANYQKSINGGSFLYEDNQFVKFNTGLHYVF